MHDYCMGSLLQVQKASTKTYPSIKEMLELRRQSSGVAPLFALVEYDAFPGCLQLARNNEAVVARLTGRICRYAHKLDIPDTVFETRSIQEIERIGVDFVLMYVHLRST